MYENEDTGMSRIDARERSERDVTNRTAISLNNDSNDEDDDDGFSSADDFSHLPPS